MTLKSAFANVAHLVNASLLTKVDRDEANESLHLIAVALEAYNNMLRSKKSEPLKPEINNDIENEEDDN
jgi:hypothetical protein